MSDNKKICFISCVNNDLFYEECLKYIQNLIVPDGYTIDTISIKDAKSMCEGYNAAMFTSDAKYKVYLHQDTFIINKNFISDILELFNSNEQIGMLGVCGTETIPTNAIWWYSVHKYGKVYENHTGEMEILAFNEVNENYHNVKTLDGLIMVTQYDLPWRDDIFNGWHFYDISQCTEFILAGYEVVVPNQNTPWCIHDCGVVETKNGFNEYRNIYLDEYSKRIFP
ncbi:glycosyltransferase family protein [Clostridium neuense]|uniref:Glycosyltransferase family protein n=1 Tax=Clostridium neuense TaxID=1728934 RepID=A0ABW8TGL3_9CLOT